MKYKFWIEVEDGAGGINLVEWCNLTQYTAKLMYNTSLKNCHTHEVKRFGWGRQE